MATFNDPAFSAQQWFLGPSGVNLTPLYSQYSGAGVRIGVVDTGILYTSAELSGQVDVAAGWNALTHSSDAFNAGGDQHGTVVAEYLAAKANNGVGGVGAAYGATLVGFKMDTVSARTPAQELELLQRQWQMDISHNSWSYSGDSFRDNFLGSYAQQGAAVADAAIHGRGGLGTIIVRSAGNGSAAGDSVNAHNYQNNRFTMSVGATNANGDVQGFSNKGPAVWVVAPGDATSSAAPLLSGTVALMLQANPGLGYRDVQQIIAITAAYTDGSGPWKTNAAPGFANGGGYRTSTSAGFGKVDAYAAVRLAESWDSAPKTEANILRASAAGPGFGVPDLGSASRSVSITGDMIVERALLTLDLSHTKIGDLQISLISPGGTESLLLDRLGNGGFTGSGTLNFTFSSNQFFGEAGAGTWTLKVQDTVTGRVAQVNSWSLDLFGAPQTADDLYVFTDRYAGLAGSEPGRSILIDQDGGVDTLNAAAVTTALQIDLNPNTSSIIAGVALKIAAGTVIEKAWGGDGNDIIIGNAVANVLHGGRGDDTISGEAGNDTINGGAGDDTISGGLGDDLIEGGAGTDTAVYGSTRASLTITSPSAGTYILASTTGGGTDTVSGVEFFTFAGGAPVAAADLISGGGGSGVSTTPTEGNDSITGTAGPDNIAALGGNDTINGGAGDDTISGGLGDDLIEGGAGTDTAVYGSTRASLTITSPSAGTYIIASSGGGGTDTVSGVEFFTFAGGAPVAAADLISGGGGVPQFSVMRGGVASQEAPTAYSGPVAYLQWQFLGTGAGEVVIASSGNDFLNLLGGDDAANAGAGNDVIDGGLGSNFLTGGSGRDVFFLDGRGSEVTWATITDWQAGEELSLWGWRSGVSQALWVDNAGAEGYRGVTMHADLDGNGRIDASVTWTGLTRSDLPSATEHKELLWFHS